MYWLCVHQGPAPLKIFGFRISWKLKFLITWELVTVPPLKVCWLPRGGDLNLLPFGGNLTRSPLKRGTKLSKRPGTRLCLTNHAMLTGVIAWTPNRKEPRRTGFKNNGTYSWLHSRKPFLKPSVPSLRFPLMLPLVKIFKWVNDGIGLGKHKHEGEPLRRVRRCLARLYEASRFCKKGTLPPEPLKKTSGVCQPPGVWPTCSGRYLGCKTTPKWSRTGISEKNIQRWKEQVNDRTLKGMSRWVRKKEAVHTSVDIHDNGCTATSPGEAAHMIHSYWDHLWTTQQIDVPSVAQKLVSDYGLIPPKESWKLPLKDVWMVIRAAHGAAGTDGWTGEEVRHLPYLSLGPLKKFFVPPEVVIRLSCCLALWLEVIRGPLGATAVVSQSFWPTKEFCH